MSPLKPTTIGHLEQITHLSCEISTRPIYGWVTHKTTAHKKKKSFPYFSNGFPLLFQWLSPTFPMVVPYFSNGCPLLFQWLSHTFPVVIPVVFPRKACWRRRLMSWSRIDLRSTFHQAFWGYVHFFGGEGNIIYNFNGLV